MGYRPRRRRPNRPSRPTIGSAGVGGLRTASGGVGPPPSTSEVAVGEMRLPAVPTWLRRRAGPLAKVPGDVAPGSLGGRPPDRFRGCPGDVAPDSVGRPTAGSSVCCRSGGVCGWLPCRSRAGVGPAPIDSDRHSAVVAARSPASVGGSSVASVASVAPRSGPLRVSSRGCWRSHQPPQSGLPAAGPSPRRVHTLRSPAESSLR